MSGCRGDEGKAIEAKCDAPLRVRAEEMARAGESAPLDVLGRADGAIDESRRLRLSGAGAEVLSVAENLFTARVPLARLGRLARLDFVQSLQLSQQREPLGP